MDQLDIRVVTVVVQSFLDVPCDIPAYIEDVDDDVETLAELAVADVGETTRHRDSIQRIEGYVENVVPSMSGSEFKSHFRLSRTTFDVVLNLIGDKLERQITGNPMIPGDKQLLMTLWRIGTPDSFRSIHNRFNVGKATAVRAVRRCARALASLAPQLIQWPSGDRAQEVIAGFSRIGAFPGAIGAIDGTHIHIPAPVVNPGAYVNRKGFHSIQVQVVCDHKLLFTDVIAGHVGSVHDARVLRLSKIQDFLEDDSKFPFDSHLIGDPAYPLHVHLMVPFTDNGHLSRREKNFNFCLSSARVYIERAIGLLKLRWRSLLHCLAMEKLEEIPYHVLAAAVLHNICLLHEDQLEELGHQANPPPDHGEGNAGAEPQQNRGEAVVKRNRISAALRMRDV